MPTLCWTSGGGGGESWSSIQRAWGVGPNRLVSLQGRVRVTNFLVGLTWGGEPGVQDSGCWGVVHTRLVSLQGRFMGSNFLVVLTWGFRGLDVPPGGTRAALFCSTWLYMAIFVLQRPWLALFVTQYEMFTLPPFKFDWPPPTVGLRSEQPADFVRLF